MFDIQNFQFTASDEADPDTGAAGSTYTAFQFTASDEADQTPLWPDFIIAIFQFTASDEADLESVFIKSCENVFQFTASDEADRLFFQHLAAEMAFNSQPQMRLTSMRNEIQIQQ